MKRRWDWSRWIIWPLMLLGWAGVQPGFAQAPYRLTLSEAIARALTGNVNGQVAQERIAQAQGAKQRKFASAFLPKFNTETYANVHNVNLNAFGLSFPGVPQTVGPLSNYDFRLYGQQNLIDRSSLHSFRASDQALTSEKMANQNTRDDIVRAVASFYLAAESAAARSAVAQTRVNDANTLLKLARDKHDAGTATGVDVLRAEVQLANDKQVLLVAETQYRVSLLILARTIGMDPNTPLELAETLQFRPLAQSAAETLEQTALQSRADYLSLAHQRESIVEQQRANRARWYPRLSMNGNFGGIGRSVGGVLPTGLLQAQLDLTVYDRDREGESAELASQLRSVDDRIADLRRGVSQDIQEALLNLTSAAEQVEVATQGQTLARRELQLSQDRFASGMANNVEVVTAQDELARAEENYILAVSGHVDAKFALARALGDTDKNIRAFAESR